MKRLVLTLFLVILGATRLEAATFWVNPGSSGSHCVDSASDPGAGSSSQTITQALACAGAFNTTQGAGDTVIVKDGTYDEHITTIPGGTAGSPFTLKAQNPRGATIKRSGGGTIMEWNTGGTVSGIQYIVIDGFVIDGQNIDGNGIRVSVCGPASDACGIPDQRPNVNHITINNVEAKNIGGDGFKLMGQFYTLTNNFIHNTGFSHPGQSHSCYCYIAQSTIGPGNIMSESNGYEWHPNTNNEDGVVFDNVIFGNTFRNMTNHDSWAVLLSGRNQKFFSNIIYGNVQGIIVGHGAAPTDIVAVYENTFVDNNNGPHNGLGTLGSVAIQFSSNVQVKNNIFRNNGTVVYNIDAPSVSSNNLSDLSCSGCTVGNPNFVDQAGRNFHLNSPSPAIDAGADLGGTPYNVDFDGNSRPQGAGSFYDIGAFEFLSGTIPIVTITGTAPSGSCDAGFTQCTFIGVSNNIIQLSGTSTQSGGAVSWSCDRCGVGTASGIANWTTSPITLKSGINIITVSGTSGGNTGQDQITVTFIPTFPGNTLAAAYGFEEGGGISATDSSGNSNTGTLTNGPTRVAGRYGQALNFDGSNDYVIVADANSLDFTQSFTLSAWVQPASPKIDFRAVMSKGSAPINHPYELYATVSGVCGNGGISGFITVNGSSGPTTAACSSTPLATPGVWTHLAVTYDGSNLKLYKNGVLITTSPVSGYMEQSTGTLQIGASEFGENFQGLIDEVRL